MNAASDTVRAFVAIDIGAAVRTALAAELGGVRRRWPRIKWVEPGNLHLTLAFLGHIYPAQVESAGDVLAGVAAETHPFDLTMAGLGCYGPPRSPRVIWVGATAGADLLKDLQVRQADGLRRIGLTPESRPFSPHLTLGRVKTASDAAGLGTWLRAEADRPFGIVPVRALQLMRSELRPEGPLYSTLKTSVLGAPSLSRG